jgi:alginate O-acetyltransferase complex protein AlgI
MLFNSIEFAVFLPLVFILYWLVFAKYLKVQNLLILIVSYIFYGWWDWRFLSLILLSSIVDYAIGLLLEDFHGTIRRKVLLGISIIVNIGILGIFKYFNFFADSFASMLGVLGFSVNPYSIKVILPVGISFYTFQTLSYSIDVFRRKLKASRNIVNFFAYVSFFPQLVAGPIERATNLLPQFERERLFNYPLMVSGLRLILWGLFKKMVIADNLAIYVNDIFDNYAEYSGSVLALGTVYFAFQIYCDFSGYSDIAIGTARLLGFNLMINFKTPYFSRDIAEFWRRWHISLSTWFRDYLYIPLGGSRGTTQKVIRNIFIIFIVSGFWHGANWTFIIWGALNALYFIPLFILGKNRNHLGETAEGQLFPDLHEFFKIIMTFGIVCFAWIFFRAENLYHAWNYILGIFSPDFFSIPGIARGGLVLVFLFVVLDWFNRLEHTQMLLPKVPRIVRWSGYTAIVMLIYFKGNTGAQDFIYFQF